MATGEVQVQCAGCEDQRKPPGPAVRQGRIERLAEQLLMIDPLLFVAQGHLRGLERLVPQAQRLLLGARVGTVYGNVEHLVPAGPGVQPGGQGGAVEIAVDPGGGHHLPRAVAHFVQVVEGRLNVAEWSEYRHDILQARRAAFAVGQGAHAPCSASRLVRPRPSSSKRSEIVSPSMSEWPWS